MRPPRGPVMVALGLGVSLALAATADAGLTEVGRLLASGDRLAIRDHLRGFGVWAPLVSFGLIQVQAIVAPLPAFPIVYANGLLFGTLWGGLLSWGSGLCSAVLCFVLARRLGRPLVERVTSQTALARADRLLARHGAVTVLLARLIPLTAFDLMSYAAGLTRIRLGAFTAATAVGMAPATFVMAAAGDIGAGSLPELLGALAAVAALALAAAWLAPRLRRRLAPPAALGEAER